MKVLRLDTELNRRVTWAKHNFRFTIPCHEIANVQNSKVSWTFSMKGSDTAILTLGSLRCFCSLLGALNSHHGSYEWIIMLKKCGRTVFHLIWVIGTYGTWKKSKSCGQFWSYQLNSTANPAHLPQKLGQLNSKFCVKARKHVKTPF